MSKHRVGAVLTGILVFCTLAASEAFGQLWWTQKFPAAAPSPRSGTAMAYDALHQEVVLFGGHSFSSDGSTYIDRGDTWVWDGNNWTQKFPATSPSPRVGHGMAYDEANHRVVLFGGFSGSGKNVTYFTDTWVWDGSNWAQKAPVNVPSSNVVQTIAYDAARQNTVQLSPLQTWVWNGVNWTVKASTSGPQVTAAERYQVAYDTARQQVVVLSSQFRLNSLE